MPGGRAGGARVGGSCEPRPDVVPPGVVLEREGVEGVRYRSGTVIGGGPVVLSLSLRRVDVEAVVFGAVEGACPGLRATVAVDGVVLGNAVGGHRLEDLFAGTFVAGVPVTPRRGTCVRVRRSAVLGVAELLQDVGNHLLRSRNGVDGRVRGFLR